MFVNLIIILRCGIIINIKCVGINVKYKRTVEIEVKIGERIKIKLWLKLIAYGIIQCKIALTYRLVAAKILYQCVTKNVKIVLRIRYFYKFSVFKRFEMFNQLFALLFCYAYFVGSDVIRFITRAFCHFKIGFNEIYLKIG